MIVTANNYSEFHDLIGGKARELFRLSQKSHHVPELFSVSSDAFHKFIAGSIAELTHIIDSEQDVPAASRRCHEVLDKLGVDEDLCNEILDNCDATKLYSVRSSALQEDSLEHSFAGLFVTSLFIPKSQIINHLKQCWLSAFNPNIIEYCRINQINPLEIRLGVVVQEMVNSASSGIVFTANPAGSLMEVAVVAGYGLGEGVVSNRVEADTYVYDKITKKLDRDIAHKTTRIVFDDKSGYGVLEQQVPEQDADRPVLDNDTLFELLKVVETLSDSYSIYLDIEWAIDQSSKVHILQSRPITTIPQGKLMVFDNNNIVESYPNITLPLTSSIAQKGYELNFYYFFSSLKLSHVKYNREVFRNLVGYIQGRIYYNLTNWIAMADLLPLPKRFTVSSFDDMVGMRQSLNLESARVKSRKTLASVVGFFSVAIWKFIFIKHYFKTFKTEFDRLRGDFNAADLSALNNHELIDFHHDCFDRFARMASNPLTNDFFIMLFTALTMGLLNKLDFKDANAVFNGLMCGEPEMENVLPVHSVLHMAQMLRNDETLLESVQTDKSFLNEPHGQTDGCAFKAAFHRHISMYGNRAPEELKMEVDTYKENPSLLLENIFRYVPLDITIDKMTESESRIRKEAEKTYRETLPTLSLRKAVLNFCINRVRLLLKNRESARLDRGIAHGMFRTILLTIGKNLHREGALQDERDILYLTVNEIDNYIYGTGAFENLREVVALRKKQLETYKFNKPDERLYFSGTIPLNFVKQKKITKPSSSNVLVGIPCSPGKLECEAVVVHNLSDAGDVSGKIIIAQMTDPGWVFLMIAAAGIIVEKGSILSHTAIVGRELGIPTIVGIQGATEIIKTGQVLKMNAYTGEVEL